MSNSEMLASLVEDTVLRADGHWCGELKSNATITSEYVFLRYALGLDLKADGPAYTRWLLSDQNPDGSWGLAPDIPGDVSATTEAYLALKILGTNTDSPPMQRARAFVLQAGGVAAVRVFTRIFLATFGLFPWNAVPQIPVELVLLPSSSPINIFKLASWARGTIAPLLLICHHQPVYALPNGHSATNDYLNELWQDSTNKSVSYGKSLWSLACDRDMAGLAFTVVDKILYQLGGLRSVPFVRTYARRKCVKWILDRQETSGDWGGIFPPMHASMYALMLEGYRLDDEPVRLGFEALERFAWQDNQGKRIQACVSPVWDTALMTVGLCDIAFTDKELLDRAISWIKRRQILDLRGDWRVYRPNLAPGGFSFEYDNTWYPDVDDTAAIILAQIKQDPKSVSSFSVMQATKWILGMQNPDGGWAAFDVENDKLFLNKIPFSDMDSLCDTSCPDITGRILEAFGLLMQTPDKTNTVMHIYPQLRLACHRAIGYLASTQESNGSWFGRWGCNYIYGTSHALCGLAYHSNQDKRVHEMVEPALEWLQSIQNEDGGWGESLLTYKTPEMPIKGHRSTAAQTAWALMALLAYQPHTDEMVELGVRHLVESLNVVDENMGTWTDKTYTGTGFPNHFYLGYVYYAHYFPMMALGRYMRISKVYG
ncbi:terpene cyclase/mutase family protein [Aspergillus homomorphus CBS 101889]|uniref:Terpene cyclase/mutase family member n=1 Tax=Aspergillus homomorphus (strain CBS 101889) TaxID=1450537 RepID=A0A395HUL3_ASPHC|nr:squalene cyclase [Aspergillus homomorphus CBS 101889]RAL11209.1 squalene cyclase [Aspergillus homomorphus CBS 101889]